MINWDFNDGDDDEYIDDSSKGEKSIMYGGGRGAVTQNRILYIDYGIPPALIPLKVIFIILKIIQIINI